MTDPEPRHPRVWQCHACTLMFETRQRTGRLPTVCPDCRTAGSGPLEEPPSPLLLLAREVTELRCAVTIAACALNAREYAVAQAALEAVTGLPMREPGAPRQHTGHVMTPRETG